MRLLNSVKECPSCAMLMPDIRSNGSMLATCASDIPEIFDTLRISLERVITSSIYLATPLNASPSAVIVPIIAPMPPAIPPVLKLSPIPDKIPEDIPGVFPSSSWIVLPDSEIPFLSSVLSTPIVSFKSAMSVVVHLFLVGFDALVELLQLGFLVRGKYVDFRSIVNCICDSKPDGFRFRHSPSFFQLYSVSA